MCKQKACKKNALQMTNKLTHSVGESERQYIQHIFNNVHNNFEWINFILGYHDWEERKKKRLTVSLLCGGVESYYMIKTLKCSVFKSTCTLRTFCLLWICVLWTLNRESKSELNLIHRYNRNDRQCESLWWEKW